MKVVVLGCGGHRWEMDVDGERWWWWWEVAVRGGGERFRRGVVYFVMRGDGWWCWEVVVMGGSCSREVMVVVRSGGRR